MLKRLLCAAALAAAVGLVWPQQAYATVTTTSSIVSYTGNGATTAFSVTFKFLSSSDLVVTVDGVTKTITTHYTVTGAGAATGGTVTFVSAPASGAAIQISRDVAYTQPTSLRAQGTFSPATHEAVFDRLLMQIQQIRDNASTFTATGIGAVVRLMTSKAGDIVSANDYGTLQQAITAAGTNGTLVIPKNYATTLASGLTISSAGLTIKADPGATITKGFNGDMVTVAFAATGVTIEGGTWDGNQAAGKTGHGIVVLASGFTLHNATVRNNSQQGVYILNSNFRVESNTFTGNSNLGIFSDNGASDGVILGNTVDNTGTCGANSSNIGVHSTSVGTTAQRVVVADNKLLNGCANAWCIETGAFGGNDPTDLSISGNQCTSTGNNWGGYSIDHTSNSTFSGNTFNQGAFTGSIAGIELVGSSGLTVTGNAVNGGTGTRVGVWVEGSSNLSVVGNVINGFSNSIANASGIRIELPAACSPCTSSNNVFAANRILFPATGSSPIGIYFDLNDASANASNNLVLGNSIGGQGVASSVGIWVRKLAGTLTKTVVQANVLDNLATGVQLNSDDATQVASNLYTSTVTTALSSTASTNLQRLDLLAGGGAAGANSAGATFTGGSTNGVGVSATGAGSGAGVSATGGTSSGSGAAFTGGATNGVGVTGTGSGTGQGGLFTGGGSNGSGVRGVGGATNGAGMVAQGNGTGNGINATGGGTAGAVGVQGTGGSSGGSGVSGIGTSNNAGVVGSGNGTGSGVSGTGGATGAGVTAVAGGGGSPATGAVVMTPQVAPSAPGDGAVWIETTSNVQKARINGATVQTSPTKGTITLSAGSGTATVLSGAICTCTDTTANASVKCAVAATTLTATGTGTDVINYLCF